MATGAYGRRLGRSVGVASPPTVRTQLLRKAEFAATRVIWDERQVGVLAQIDREDALLVCLQRRDIPGNPYWIDGRPVEMSPVGRGQSTLLDLNHGHASFLSAAIDCVAMYVPRAALDKIAEEQGARRIMSIQTPPGVPVDDQVIWHLGECLLPALERPEQANRLFVEHLALALLVHVASTYGNMSVEARLRRGGLAPWRVRRAKEMLMAHIDGEIGLEELARECGLSRSHFARAFKSTTGMPPHTWLVMQRVERAKDLLLNSSLSIGQIAEACGFADQSHLTRVFARLVHASPGQWRRIRHT